MIELFMAKKKQIRKLREPIGDKRQDRVFSVKLHISFVSSLNVLNCRSTATFILVDFGTGCSCCSCCSFYD